MLRVKLTRMTDGRICVEVTLGAHRLLFQLIHLTDSEPVTLEVSDE